MSKVGSAEVTPLGIKTVCPWCENGFTACIAAPAPSQGRQDASKSQVADVRRYAKHLRSIAMRDEAGVHSFDAYDARVCDLAANLLEDLAAAPAKESP